MLNSAEKYYLMNIIIIDDMVCKTALPERHY